MLPVPRQLAGLLFGLGLAITSWLPRAPHAAPRLQAQLTLAQVYDDNQHVSPVAPMTVIATRLLPHVEASYVAPRLDLHVGLAYGADLLAVSATKQGSIFDPVLARRYLGMLAVRGAVSRRLRLGLRGNYTDATIPPDLQTTIVDMGYLRTRRLTVGPSLTYSASRVTTLDAAHTFVRDHQANIKTYMHRIVVDLAHRAGHRTTALAGVRFAHFDFDAQGTALSTVVDAGFQYRMSQVVALTIRTGSRLTLEHGRAPEATPVAISRSAGRLTGAPDIWADLNYATGPRRASLVFARLQEVVPGQAGLFQISRLQAQLGYAFRASSRLAIDAAYSNASATSSSVSLLTAGVTLSHQMQPDLELHFTYRYARQWFSSGRADGNPVEIANHNLFCAGLTVRSNSDKKDHERPHISWQPDPHHLAPSRAGTNVLRPQQH